MISEMLAHTPLYVWFLLAFLLYRGRMAMKPHTASLRTLSIMPAVMFFWSASNLKHADAASIGLWALSLSLGAWLGLRMIRSLDLQIDRSKKQIGFPGSRIPLILLGLIFSLRYVLGASYGFHPELRGTAALLGLESIANILSGLFIGRLFGYLQRFRTTEG